MGVDKLRLAAAQAVLDKAVDRGDLSVAMGMVGDSSGVLDKLNLLVATR